MLIYKGGLVDPAKLSQDDRTSKISLLVDPLPQAVTQKTTATPSIVHRHCIMRNHVDSTRHLNGNSDAPARVPKMKPQLSSSNHEGLLSLLPQSWAPYAELMRLDRPAGFYAFYVPYLIGVGYAANLAEPVPRPSQVLFLGVFFLFFCIILRGVACAWNDNIDQEFDRKVARCQSRPIARGAITTFQGHVLAICLILAEAPFLMILPRDCTYHVVCINVLFGFYPFMKRVTNYPQLFLGFPFAWAIPLSCASLGLDPSRERLSMACLFGANVLWTMIYDTVYAHQDVKDDVKAGVKSMAVRFRHSTKIMASVLAVGQISLLVATAVLAHLSIIFTLIGCLGSAIALWAMLAKVNLDDSRSCAWFFHYGFWYVGGCIIIGFFGAYLQNWYSASSR